MLLMPTLSLPHAWLHSRYLVFSAGPLVFNHQQDAQKMRLEKMWEPKPYPEHLFLFLGHTKLFYNNNNKSMLFSSDANQEEKLSVLPRANLALCEMSPHFLLSEPQALSPH